MKRQPDFNGKMHHFFIQYRQAARQAQADRADMRVRRGAEFSAAAAENFCFRF